MKKILIGLMTLASVNAFSFSQVDCALLAQEKLDLNGYGVANLCSGASSKAPVECAELANKKLGYTGYDLANLCSGTKNNSPVDCALKASKNETLDLNTRAISALCGKPTAVSI